MPTPRGSRQAYAIRVCSTFMSACIILDFLLIVKISRRRFLSTSLLFSGATALVDGSLIEPKWIRQSFLDMSHLGIGKRIIQFSDLHYKGDLDYGQKIIALINNKNPDLVFFTGDLVERKSREHLEEALGFIRKIESPVYGVPGNHDPTDSASITEYIDAFRHTGGKFLINERMDFESFVIHGGHPHNGIKQVENKTKILLYHYPAVGDVEMKEKYDLILSGHSHGGQIRLPFYGAIILPPGVGKYDKGYYDTSAGSLYVNVGVGEYLLPIRFFCRPEITEIVI